MHFSTEKKILSDVLLIFIFSWIRGQVDLNIRQRASFGNVKLKCFFYSRLFFGTVFYLHCIFLYFDKYGVFIYNFFLNFCRKFAWYAKSLKNSQLNILALFNLILHILWTEFVINFFKLIALFEVFLIYDGLIIKYPRNWIRNLLIRNRRLKKQYNKILIFILLFFAFPIDSLNLFSKYF